MSIDAQTPVADNAMQPPSFNPLKATPEELEQRIKEMKDAAQAPAEAPKEDTEVKTESKEDTPKEEPSTESTAKVDETLEQRYKDLQSYSEKRYNSITEKLNQALQENADLMKQVKDATVVKPEAPLSEEDFEALKKDFPNVDSIAHQRALTLFEEMSKPLYDKIEALEKDLGKSQELTAKEQLRKLHPDFEKIEHDPDFKAWYDDQPQGVQKLITSKSIYDIDKGLKYYKLEKGIKTEKEKKLEASTSVDTSAPSTTVTAPPAKTPLSEVRRKMAELSKRGGKKLEQYVEWYEKAKAEDQIDFNT